MDEGNIVNTLCQQMIQKEIKQLGQALLTLELSVVAVAGGILCGTPRSQPRIANVQYFFQPNSVIHWRILQHLQVTTIMVQTALQSCYLSQWCFPLPRWLSLPLGDLCRTRHWLLKIQFSFSRNRRVSPQNFRLLYLRYTKNFLPILREV